MVRDCHRFVSPGERILRICEISGPESLRKKWKPKPNMANNTSSSGDVPRVVIVGGGFGGLAAAKALRRAPVQVVLIDRTNHHLFQPLLYQVATSVLSPSQISSPIS